MPDPDIVHPSYFRRASPSVLRAGEGVGVGVTRFPDASRARRRALRSSSSRVVAVAVARLDLTDLRRNPDVFCLSSTQNP
jgi:hypothetical protein